MNCDTSFNNCNAQGKSLSFNPKEKEKEKELDSNNPFPEAGDFWLGLESTGLVYNSEQDKFFLTPEVAKSSKAGRLQFWVEEFVKEAKAFEKMTPKPTHLIYKQIRALLANYDSRNLTRAIRSCFQDEVGLDSLLELLSCPIYHSLIREPVLLDSGQIVDRESIEKWVKSGQNNNPFTRAPLSYTKDPLIQKLLYALDAKFSEGAPRTTEAKKTYRQVIKSPFFVNESPLWCRALAIIMQPKTFFIRKKGRNHFVLEARLPISEGGNSSTPYSLLKVSFCVDKGGKFQLINNPTQIFETMEDLLTNFGCEGYMPLSPKEKHALESTVNKEVFLANISLSSPDSPQKDCLLNLIKQLEHRFTEEKVRQLAMGHDKMVLFRASINPTSFPSLTAYYEFNNGNSRKKLKLGFLNGNLYIASGFAYGRTQQGDYLVKFSKNGQEKMCVPKELNPEDPIEKLILNEFNFLKDNNLLANMGQGFFIKEDPILFTDQMKAENLYLYSELDRGGYELDNLRDSPYGL
ncbi:U-box domain-containing protein [Criblamydia sequanensis]|uniref:U-box domain-containing protein n=1 Tax=Candidatus Criblamydia sequanensis CRIB-18 TaxID=1437425 RepID=A0A090DWT0_9BACT|nr:U-box domain-containing protein [Criblamydia sequanensis]CDR33299.1 hypothetical protein CSEC_0462 [Criblamydia sequanensis CRIB-18]